MLVSGCDPSSQRSGPLPATTTAVPTTTTAVPTTTTAVPTTTAPPPSEVVRQAAQRVLGQPASSLVFTGQAVVASERVSLHGSGLLEPPKGAVKTTLSFRFEGEQFSQTALQSGGHTYVDEVADGQDMLAVLGVRWAQLPVTMATEAEHEGPLGILKALASPGCQARSLGPALVGGHAVTGYQVLVPGAAPADKPRSGTEAPHFKVWLSSQGDLVRMDISMSVTGLGQVDLRASLSAQGQPVVLKAPPASEVAPYQRLVDLLNAK